MSPSRRHLGTIALSLAWVWTAGAAWADKPEGKGKDKNGNGPRDRGPAGGAPQRAAPQAAGAAVVFRFGDDDRRIVGDYYRTQVKAGHCPPGLAKKGNGCQPPGQAKKWQRGRPLPAGVRYYALPVELRVRLPVPPPNHRYVQIAGDILLIAIGTAIVVDAIEDILR